MPNCKAGWTGSSWLIACRANGRPSSWSSPPPGASCRRRISRKVPARSASPMPVASCGPSSRPSRWFPNTDRGGLSLYLEDLHVGQRFESRPHVLDEAQIKAFAREFDPQPFHLSEEGATGTLFGTLAASGWHTAALTMRLMVESVPLADGLVGAQLELGWPKPTRPGMTLQVFSE